MTKDNDVAKATKRFPSEEQVLSSWFDKKLDGTLDSGSHFSGILRNFDEHRLFLEGNRGQTIIIKRKRISRLEAV